MKAMTLQQAKEQYKNITDSDVDLMLYLFKLDYDYKPILYHREGRTDLGIWLMSFDSIIKESGLHIINIHSYEMESNMTAHLVGKDFIDYGYCLLSFDECPFIQLSDYTTEVSKMYRNMKINSIID